MHKADSFLPTATSTFQERIHIM